jgi:hypothetical protein
MKDIQFPVCAKSISWGLTVLFTDSTTGFVIEISETRTKYHLGYYSQCWQRISCSETWKILEGFPLKEEPMETEKKIAEEIDALRNRITELETIITMKHKWVMDEKEQTEFFFDKYVELKERCKVAENLAEARKEQIIIRDARISILETELRSISSEIRGDQ